MKTKLAQSKSKWVWKRVKTPGGGIRYFSTGDPKTAEFFKGLAARLRAEDKAKRAKIVARATKSLPEFASRPYLVAFIDILGFGREIEKANTQEDLEKAYRKIRRVQEEFQHPSASEDRTRQTELNQEYGRRVIALSDAVVVAITPDCPTKSLMGSYDLLGFALYELILAQARCACQGIFVRGGISHGSFYFDDDVLLSPALARAYELENKFAKYPAIVIADSTRRLILGDSKQVHFRADDDPTITFFRRHGRRHWRTERLFFLDYLRVMINDDHRGWLPQDRKEYLAAIKNRDVKRQQILLNRRAMKDAAYFLGSHKRAVRRAFENAGSESVHKKYRWLMRYHNDSVRRDLPYIRNQIIDI